MLGGREKKAVSVSYRKQGCQASQVVQGRGRHTCSRCDCKQPPPRRVPLRMTDCATRPSICGQSIHSRYK